MRHSSRSLDRKPIIVASRTEASFVLGIHRRALGCGLRVEGPRRGQLVPSASDRSIQLIDSLGLSADASIIDVGAGASTLVDDLLDRGFRNLTLLDGSERALAVTSARLAERASQIRWVAADIVSAKLPASCFQLWHDRAVLHFLSRDADRAAYAALARASVAPDGHALISGFAADGPLKCSNRPVVRASPEDIAATLGSAFRLVHSNSEIHHTPWGAEQSFSYALCRRVR